ncbi:hypothetical protein J6TS2_26410 [Heyndrickxia sporothermodurans]|nr:hypothetical protein J6TS2_26410 [Heyndrickxia sporothermodurans]
MRRTILEKGAERFGVGYSALTLLGGFDQNVYGCKTKDFVIKFLSCTKYDLESIKREIGWMDYLAKNGLNITASVLSKRNQLIEVIGDEEGTYFVIAFEQAKGRFVGDLESNFPMIKKWGKVMGRMHHLAKSYSSPFNYPEWNDSSVFKDFPLIAGDEVYKKWNEFIDRLQHLPKDQHCYGLIHNDLHQTNFHVDNHEMILFDFGDLELNWFGYDIAISLYHAVQTIPSSEQVRKREFTKRFFDSFLSGYQTENTLDEYWIEKIPFFLNYRQIYSYIYFSKYLNIEEADESIRKALGKMKNNIVKDLPFLEFSLLS